MFIHAVTVEPIGMKHDIDIVLDLDVINNTFMASFNLQ